MHEFGSFRDASHEKVDEASKTDNIFFVRGCRICADCFGLFVIGLQARIGNVEVEEVKVLLVELGLESFVWTRPDEKQKIFASNLLVVA